MTDVCMTDVCMTDVSPQHLIAYLRSPQAIHDRAQELFNLGVDDRLEYFTIDFGVFDRVIEWVDQITRSHYPDLAIPLHSRWRHFPADRVASLFAGLSPIERLKAKLDLVIPSILLDAGAGPDWRYVDAMGQTWQRSEGLAIATFEMFANGQFAADGGRQTDAIGLAQITLADLQAAFQVTPTNPIVGLEGRRQLLHNLGRILQQRREFRGDGPVPRLGNWADDWIADRCEPLAIPQLLNMVLTTFSDLWPDRLTIAGVNLGDVWTHPQLTPMGIDPMGIDQTSRRYIPFHKLSQWLTSSLIEPLQEWGCDVVELDQITGLAEYRNGGLWLDMGVLKLRDPSLAQVSHRADAVLVVEWRGLTLHLLRLLTDRLRQRWQQPDLQLIQVLQGGTWAAGRAIAAQLRPQAAPPLRIVSDGTLF
jgi:Protein of unknown function (DUF1688)